MSVLINYPGSWNDGVPEGIQHVAQGVATINTGIFSRLEILEHLVFPVYIGLDKLRVLDAACGTGEWLIQMALCYRQAKLIGYDPYQEARDQARVYISELGIDNLEIVDDLPAEQFDLILHSRPLQHMIDNPEWIKNISNVLAPDGAILLFAETSGNEIPDEVSRLRNGEMNPIETEQVLQSMLSELSSDEINCWAGFLKYLEDNGLIVYMGMHPVNYEPGRYIAEGTALPEWINSLGMAERGRLAEKLGSFERHYILCGKGPRKDMPQLGELQTETLIPHLSPYATVFPTDDRYQVGLSQHYMMLQPGVEIEDLSLPAELLSVLQKIDGKASLEQLHRNFLPMPWERFLSVIEAAVEVEIVYLHRRK